MNRTLQLCLATLCVCLGLMAQSAPLSVKGTVIDPSGAAVPDAQVFLRGPRGEQRTRSGKLGEYTLTVPQPGKYTLRVLAKGFSLYQQAVDISAASSLDVQLSITADAQVVDVTDEIKAVTTDPASNSSALVLKEKDLEALSDDPDELQAQLQALAGPGAGPNGGQVYIDGFTGGQLPPKSSIREIRVNSNPFSPEYERPGFGRIEIFTKPGTDQFHGSAFLQFNKEALNSRSPLLTQSTRPPYKTWFGNFNLTGPIVKQKASFGFNFDRRAITENAFIIATMLDSNFNPLSVNQAVVTPQTRTTISPRLDYLINQKNTMVLRYSHTQNDQEGQGIGGFSLASKGYKATDTENSIQFTETAILNATTISESRFQFLRSDRAEFGDATLPAITVQGAFNGGGAQIGNSNSLATHLEFSNVTSMNKGRHAYKFGGRIRHVNLDDLSVNNFSGTYSFFSGQGVALDANNNPIAGPFVDLTALDRYRNTLILQQKGFTAAQIRTYGLGASQLSLSGGMPASTVGQYDFGFFVNDDWKARPNLTVSYGLRYEAQTNLSDYKDFSPRIGIAWAIDGNANKVAKTIFRGGFGIFYDRLSENSILASERFNGITQQSYLLQNPDTFPVIPSLASLAASPQRLQIIDNAYRAPRVYQISAGIERQLTQKMRLSIQYISARGVYVSRQRNINAPINGLYPFGDKQLRYLSEATGFSRSNQLVLSPNMSFRRVSLFGFYSLGFGRSDAEGLPADPYNLRAEYGPSNFSDVRHRLIVGSSITLPKTISLSPFFSLNSGSPYNITTGRDLNLDGTTAERPALVDIAQASCQGGSLKYTANFGCFNLAPAAGTPTIGRNIGRGPLNATLNLRLSKTWGFGPGRESGGNQGGGPPDGGPDHGGGGGPRGGGGGGGAPHGGGGMRGMMGGGGGMRGGGGASTGKRYNLTFSVSAQNALNRANYGAPVGDLGSTFFGQSLTLAGGFRGGSGTYNRKVDLQLRFQF
ncbi:MAG: carboxypeptidase regulatory-like domain-containing protein [Bryobacteraceae bacterium]